MHQRNVEGLRYLMSVEEEFYFENPDLRRH